MAEKDKKRVPLAEEFSQKVIEHLEAGTAPWQRPWQGKANSMPHNPISGTVYKGSNRVWLSLTALDLGYADPRWLTFNQASEQGYRIKKGSKGTQVQYWQWEKRVPEVDESGKSVLDEDGKQKNKIVKLDRPIVRGAFVFNGTQVEGLEPWSPKLEQEFTWNPDEKAENILEASGAAIFHDQGNRAFYNIRKDEIHLPPKENFPDQASYYGTALHELAHWTGHNSRLDRQFGAFGTQDYAREELRAEIASWMLSSETGIAHDPEQHAAYVKSWIKLIQEDPYEILRACRDAERSMHYTLSLELNKKLEQESPTLVKDKETVLEPSTEEIEQWIARNVEQTKPSFFTRIISQDYDAVAEQTLVYKTYLDVVGIQNRDPYEDWSAFKSSEALFPFDGAGQENSYRALQEILSAKEKLAEKFVQRHYGVSLAEIEDQRIKKQETELYMAEKEKNLAQEKTFLAVPFAEKNLAKAAGAKWDVENKSWFAPEGADLAALEKWVPTKEVTQALPAKNLDYVSEFGKALEDAGLDLRGEQPVMDGKIQRVALIGDAPGKMSGAYCGFTDGVPAGWYQNYSSGEKGKWTSSGHVLTENEKVKLQQEAQERAALRLQERLENYKRAMSECTEIYMDAPTARPEYPYIVKKGIELPTGVRTTHDDKMLVIPAFNTDNDITTIQYINEDGSKRFHPGGQKKGSFFVIGTEKGNTENLDKLGTGEIILAEGLATGASINQATKLPVAVAFDAGNLLAVAEKIREKFPNAAITICADNDHRAKENIGIKRAQEAAKKVGGKVIIPTLNKKEVEQGLTDFNDLHQSRGLKEVAKQVSFGLQRKQNKGMER